MITRLIAVMGILAGTVLAGETLTLQISGYPSCSVQAWSFGATGGSAVPSGTASAAKTQVSNLVMTRLLDECSVNLFKAAVIQTPLSTLVLKVEKPMANGGQFPVFAMTLEGVRVSNYQLNGTLSNAEPSESVAFSFTRIKVETTEMKPDGTAGGTIGFSWDIADNRSN